MDIADLFSRFAVALGIGLLIGLERGWTSRDDAPGTRTAGIRTFALSGLLGGIVGALGQSAGGAGAGLLIGAAFLAYSAVLATFSREENRAEGTFSATTTVAGMVTFALGAYALIGDIRVAAAGAVATAGLLALREGLHGLVERITAVELRAVLVLLAMTFIALPLLPNESIGPFGGVNPREIWLIAIVLAAVSFLGYLAVKIVGTTRGVLLAAAAGGVVSSTAVMATSARQAAAHEGSPRLLAAGATLASAMSIVRTLGLVFVLNQDVFRAVMVPLGAAAAITVAAALLLAFHSARAEQEREAELRNPFSLKQVLGFALFLGALEMISRVLAETFGARGAILTAFAAGLGDVDAVSVSVTKLVPGSLDVASAGLAVLAAVAANFLSKAAIGIMVGRGWFAVAVATATAAAFVAGAIGWWLGV